MTLPIFPYHSQKKYYPKRTVTAERVVLAPGSIPHNPSAVPFDGETILHSDELMQMMTVPPSLIVVGGVTMEAKYANIFAALGIDTTLIDRHEELLPFVDWEIRELLRQAMCELGLKIRLGENVDSIHKTAEVHNEVRLSRGDTLSYSGGSFL